MGSKESFLGQSSAAFIARLLKRFNDQKVVSLQLIPRGLKNKSFIVTTPKGKLVIKIYAKGFLSQKEIERNTKVVFRLHKKDFPVVRFLRGKNKQFVQSFIDENGVARFYTASEYEEFLDWTESFINRKVLAKIASTLSGLHQAMDSLKVDREFKPLDPIRILDGLLAKATILSIREYLIPRAKYMKESPDEFIKFYRKEGQNIKKYFEKRKGLFDDSRLTHGSYELDNLLITDEKVKLVFDFDDMLLAPRTYEIGCVLFCLDLGLFFLKELIQIFLENYQRKKFGLKEIEDIIHFMRYKAFYRIGRFLTHYGYLENSGRHYESVQEKLKEYQKLKPVEIMRLL